MSTPLPALPGFATPRTYAAWPVWSGSSAGPVRFQPMPKKSAVRLWHRAREFDRTTHEPGRHGGKIGHAALQVLHALIFDFMNYRTGRLDPSYAAIASKAGVCQRTVAKALKHLQSLGILNWVRRCAESWRDGRFVLEQKTNAYAVLPESQWRGYRPPQEPPAPYPEAWGARPALPDAVTLAAQETSLAVRVQVLESDHRDGLAAALARLGRAFMTRDS